MDLLSFTSSLIGALLLLVSFLYSQRAKRAQQRKKQVLPPGPAPWPIIGNLLHVGLVPYLGLRELNRRYGPLVFVRIGSVPHVVTDDPLVVKEFLKVQDHIFASRPGNVILAELLTYGGKDIAFAPYGPHWRNMRKICTLELFAPKRLECFERLRTQEVQHVLHETWSTSQQGKPVDLRDTSNWLMIKMMTRMLFGKRYFGPGQSGPEVATKIKNMITESILMMNGFNISDYLPCLRFLDIQGQERRMKQIMSHINTLASEMIEELQQKSSTKAGCFAEVFLSLDEMENDVMKAVVIDMMAAGTDTPGVSSEWAMSELLKDPELFNQVQEEIDAVVGTDRLVKESDLQHFNKLKAVLKESFRLHPVGAILIPHLAMEDAVVLGYHIPKNTRVLINVFSLNRNPQVWEKPDEFKPLQRFFVEGEAVEFMEPDCKLVSFGAGRRMCPAASLGLTMVLLSLAHLVHAFDWSLPTQISMERAHGTMIRAEPLVAYAKPRLAPHMYAENAALA